MKLSIALAALGCAHFSSAQHKKYLKNDFHQHTWYTDGSRPFFEVMRLNDEFDCDFWANSEHGGSRDRDGFDRKWDNKVYYQVNPIQGDYTGSSNQKMWRWQGLRDYVYPDVQATRVLYPKKTVFSGVEWNPPGHEHCSTAIYAYDDSGDLISEFEYRFDRGDQDTSRNGEKSAVEGFGPLSKNIEAKEDAILAVSFMQAIKDQGLGDAWVVPAHIERAHSYAIEDFRNWLDAGPDVVLGMEGAPGHQTSGDRGFSRRSLGGGTYGGTGFFVSQVGGLWDALHAEGRKFFNFANSDYHNHWARGASDFFPGEYQQQYAYVDILESDSYQAVIDGMRSGDVWNVQGDLIDELEFTATVMSDERRRLEKACGQDPSGHLLRAGRKVDIDCQRELQSSDDTARMGMTLKVKQGDTVRVVVSLHDPQGTNLCPLDMRNPSLKQNGIHVPLNMPVLDHVDLIAGSVTGNVPATNLTDPPATDYETDTAVVKTFMPEDSVFGDDGEMVFVYEFEVQASTFLRLRGTNLPANVPFETDAAGNPLPDYEANDNIYRLRNEDGDIDPLWEAYLFDGYELPEDGELGDLLEQFLLPGYQIETNSKLDAVAEAYADLWFYSNPIWIEVE